MPVTHYVWDYASDAYLLALAESATDTTTYTSEPIRYGRLASHHNGNDDRYYHCDAVESTRQLSGKSQAVADAFLYSGFGTLIAGASSGQESFRFVGAIGCYTNDLLQSICMRARQYSPSLGRCLSIDSSDFAQPSTAFTYCSNSPTNDIDPSGQLSIRAERIVCQDCGFYQVPWHIHTSEVELAFVVQHICIDVNFETCQNRCGCEPIFRKSESCCFLELLGAAEPFVFTPELEGLPAVPDVFGNANFQGERIWQGAILQSGRLRAYTDKRVTTTPPWRPGGPVLCAGNQLLLNRHIPVPPFPSWWTRQPPLHQEEGWDFVFASWDCCPRPRQGPSTFLIAASSSGFFTSRACPSP